MTPQEIERERKERELDLERIKNNWTSDATVTASLIVVATILLAYAYYWVQTKIDSLKVYHSVYWKNVDSIDVGPGPAWFLYDSNVDSISSLRLIGESEKLLLLNLVDKNTPHYYKYAQAIDLLSFKTNSENPTSHYWILALGATCAAIGVQLRTMSNFVGVTCLKGNFNVSTRPTTSFL